MDVNIVIHFGKPSSPEYEKAIEYAKSFDKFVPIGPGAELNRIKTSNYEIVNKYYLFQNLLAIIGTWETAKVTFRDIEIDLTSFNQKIKIIADCYQEYIRAKNKSAYCDDNSLNCWGCKQITGITLHHAAAPFKEDLKYWYQFGAYTNKTTWRINKEELTQALIDIVEQKDIDFCPILQYAVFRRIVAALPSFIDLSDNKNWGHTYAEEAGTDAKKWQEVNICHKSSLSSQDLADEAHDKLNSHSKGTHDKVSKNKYLRFIPETSFEDIGGIEDIIQNIREVIELPLKKPELFNYLGIKPFRGILLWGEPGNGKTLIAKAIAHEANAHFIPVAGPDILNRGFGESEKNLRDIFDEASALQPTVIFIDEIDSIAQARLAGETAKWYSTVVNQLLSLMDGIREFGNVTLLASTNRPDLLDPALLRPGRFDYKLEVRRPSLHGCKKILEIVTRGMPMADDVDLFSFSEAIIGFSAAEIAFIAKEAAMIAIRRTIDIKSIIRGDYVSNDFSGISIKRTDFFGAIVTLKKNLKYSNKTYSLKG